MVGARPIAEARCMRKLGVLLGWITLVGCDAEGQRVQPFSPGGGTTGDASDPDPATSPAEDDDGDPGASTTGLPPLTSFTQTSSPSEPTDSTDATASGSTSGGENESSTGVASDCPWAEIDVAPGESLNVRPDPSTANAPIGSLSSGTIVEVIDEVAGESIDGQDLWYEVSTGALEGFIFAAFAVCSLDEPPEIDSNGWYLPLECGTSATVSQGNFGSTSHQNTSAYAFDFALPLGTPLVAMADGTVTHTFAGTGPGDPCYDGGGPDCFQFANYVTLLHADDTKSTYRHLQAVHVNVGDTVFIGDTVGLSGSTGYSTGRHAHVMRMEDCGEYHCQSVEIAFNDVAGDGVPLTGQTVTSGNCP